MPPLPPDIPTWLPLLLFLALQSSLARGSDPPEIHKDAKREYQVRIGEGQSFVLPCPVDTKDAQGGMMIKWTRDGGEIEFDPSASQYRPLKLGHSLKIRNPRVEDSGSYECLVVNGFGHRKVNFSVNFYDSDEWEAADGISLTKLPSSPTWINRKKMYEDASRVLRVEVGSGLELNCPSKGNPLPKISWYRNGEPIVQELTSPRSANLMIEHLRKGDEGTYACRLTNRYGSLEGEFQVAVSEIANGANLKAVSENGEVQFGSFSPSSNFKLNGLLLPTPSIDTPKNTSVRRGHTAKFQCTVQWQESTPVIKWLRKVDSRSQTLKLRPNATTLHINNMHLLMLDQDGDVNMINSTEHSGSKLTNQLTIPNVQRNDAGHYYCVVTNSLGQFVYRSVYLDVLEGISIMPFASDPPTLIILTALIAVLIFAIVAISWLCCTSAKVFSGASSVSMGANTLSTSSANSSASSHSKPDEIDKKGAFIVARREHSLCLHAEATKASPLPPRTKPPPPPPRLPLPNAPTTFLSSAVPLPRGIQDTLTGSCNASPQLRPKNSTVFNPHYHHGYVEGCSPLLRNDFLRTSTIDRGSRRAPNTNRWPSTVASSTLKQVARVGDDVASAISSNIYSSGSRTPQNDELPASVHASASCQRWLSSATTSPLCHIHHNTPLTGSNDTGICHGGKPHDREDLRRLAHGISPKELRKTHR